MPLALCTFAEPFMLRMSLYTILRDEGLVAQYQTSVEFDARDEFGHWYHLSISAREPKDGRPAQLNFHLDAVRTFGPEKSPPTTTIERFREQLLPFYGQGSLFLLWADCRIPKASLPKLGIINAMSGIATQAAGERLSVTGAKMSFDQPPFDTIEWTAVDDDVTVRIDAYQEKRIDDSLMVSAETLITMGIDKFIVEKKAIGEATRG